MQERGSNGTPSFKLMRNLLFAILIAFPLLITAQNVSEIKNSKEYLWGEGWGETFKQADKQALQNLVEKISLNIESEFKHVEEEVVADGKVDSHSAVRSVMRTYSQVTLDNTMQITISQEPNAHVIRYVKVSEMANFFRNRKIKVNDYVNLARKNESKGKIDVALRYYYWAYCLLTSLPSSDTISSPERGLHLRGWIPSQMDEIFSNIKARKQSIDGNIVTLYITYKDKPVSCLDYTYFDGRGQTNLHTATDGIGQMEMVPGMSTDNLKIKCEYEYEGQAHMEKEVGKVVEVMKGCTFRKATIMVAGDNIPSLPSKPSPKHIISETASEADPVPTCSDAEKESYEVIMGKIVEAIKTKNYSSVNVYFTDEGFDMFTKLVNYGSARIVAEPDFQYIKDGKEVLCRSLPMSFSFKNNKRKFVENVNFTFDANKKIRCIAFGLEQVAADDILKRGDYSVKSRIILIEFLENYKTAFALERIDYIRDIFDDNALIITGTVLKRADYQSKEEQTRYLDNKIIKYNRYTKNEYIAHLERCFESKEFINIRFADNVIKKAAKEFGQIYGIQIRQDYYSDNYGDTGYLFLMVDLNDPNSPVIKVRTWQPEKDPDFGWYDMGVF